MALHVGVEVSADMLATDTAHVDTAGGNMRDISALVAVAETFPPLRNFQVFQEFLLISFRSQTTLHLHKNQIIKTTPARRGFQGDSLRQSGQCLFTR